MRLILQPKSTKKAVTPYRDLTQRLLRFRFFILFRIYAIFSLFALLVSKKAAFTLFVSFSIVALNRKFAAHTTSITGSSRFNELYNRVFSIRFVRSFLLFLLSSTIYFVAIARPNGDLYTVEMIAGIPSNARGLHKAVKDGLISHTLVYLNENIVFNYFAAFMVAFGYALYEAIDDDTCMSFKSHNLSPRDALFSDFSKYAHKSLIVSLAAVSLQIFYWILRPLVLVPFYAGPFSSYYVAGTTCPSKLGATFTYPIKWAILILVWQFGSKAFNAYYCRGPIHHGKTISQASADPNATLLTGLNSERASLTHLEAWLELQEISQRFQERRISIYSDAGSEKPVWKQIYQSFDSYISQVTEDISALLPQKLEAQPEKKVTKLATLDPRTIKVSEKPVLMDRPNAVDQLVQKLQTEAESADVVGPLKENVCEQLENFKAVLLKSKFGTIFEVTNTRKVDQLLNDQNVLESAILAISKLIEHSYDEDTMGYVQADIGNALDRFDKLLKVISDTGRELSVPLPTLELTVNTAFVTVCNKFKPYFDSLKISDSVKARATYL